MGWIFAVQLPILVQIPLIFILIVWLSQQMDIGAIIVQGLGITFIFGVFIGNIYFGVVYNSVSISDIDNPFAVKENIAERKYSNEEQTILKAVELIRDK